MLLILTYASIFTLSSVLLPDAFLRSLHLLNEAQLFRPQCFDFRKWHKILYKNTLSLLLRRWLTASNFFKNITFSLSVQRDIQWCQYPSLQRLKPAANLQPANQSPGLKQAQDTYCRWYGHTGGSVHNILSPFGWRVFCTGKEMAV